jgi:hypothetical protein
LILSVSLAETVDENSVKSANNATCVLFMKT